MASVLSPSAPRSAVKVAVNSVAKYPRCGEFARICRPYLSANPRCRAERLPPAAFPAGTPLRIMMAGTPVRRSAAYPTGIARNPYAFPAARQPLRFRGTRGDRLSSGNHSGTRCNKPADVQSLVESHRRRASSTLFRRGKPGTSGRNNIHGNHASKRPHDLHNDSLACDNGPRYPPRIPDREPPASPPMCAPFRGDAQNPSDTIRTPECKSLTGHKWSRICLPMEGAIGTPSDHLPHHVPIIPRRRVP